MPINDQFMRDLTDENEGRLWPLLKRIQNDHTIALVIRNDRQIDTYYRGGRLFRISQDPSPGGAGYSASHDPNYHQTPLLPNSLRIRDREGTTHLLSKLNSIKSGMDTHFANRFRMEREFQQLTLRENNRSAISTTTDYFVVSIECADVLPGAQFDMFCCRWAYSNKAGNGTLIPGLVEMKYGNEAIDGTAGIIKHYHDARSLLLNEDNWHGMVQGMQANLRQLGSLGLLHYNPSKGGVPLVIDEHRKPQLIFLVAGYNTKAVGLLDTLNELLELRQTDKHREDEARFSLRFFSAPFAGYGMYNSCMMTLEAFRNEVARRHALGFDGE